MASAIEIAKRHHGDARLSIVERLIKESALFETAEFIKSNAQGEHVYNERSVLPTVTRRGLNQGVVPSNSQTEKKKEALSILESIAQFDSRELEIVNDVQGYKEAEVFSHTTAVGQEFAFDTFYGTGANTMRGLSTRDDFSSLGDQVVDGGGSAARASAWIINWGPDSVYYAYGQNSIAGIDVVDMGTQYVADAASGGLLRAELTSVGINSGLVVANPGQICRVANLDTSITTGFDNQTEAIIRGINRLQFAGTNMVIYVNKALIATLEIAAAFQGNMNYTSNEFGGNGRVGQISGVPVQVIDMLTSSETAVA